MALLELKCKKCGYVSEEFVKFGDKYPPCKKCGAETEQVYSGKCYGISKSGGCGGNCESCHGCGK